jgi:hypothetical protein
MANLARSGDSLDGMGEILQNKLSPKQKSFAHRAAQLAGSFP